LNEVNRRGSPIFAVGLGFIIAWFQFSVNCLTPLLSAYQTYTITIWFFGWIFLSIAAIIFPWRRKDIWDKAPEVTRQKLFGAPAIVVAGVFGLIVSVAAVWFTFVPSLQGASIYSQAPSLLTSFGFYMILPIILYFIAMYLNKRRGVPIEKRFQQIPPD